MRNIVLVAVLALAAMPAAGRQADREAPRYAGDRSLAADGAQIQWRADRVVESMRGVATVYRGSEAGTRTSSGERHDPSAMTAAHATFAIDSMVRVTHATTGRRVVVRINDRLDRTDEAVIRLSETAADRLGIDRGGARSKDDVRMELLSSRAVPAVIVGRSSAERPDERPVQHQSGPGKTDSFKRASATTTPVSPAIPDVGADADDQFTLQIGAFSTLEAAQKLAADVKGAWVMQVVENGKRVYRVYFGQYEKERQARSAQDRLKKQGRNSFLRKIPA